MHIKEILNETGGKCSELRTLLFEIPHIVNVCMRLLDFGSDNPSNVLDH